MSSVLLWLSLMAEFDGIGIECSGMGLPQMLPGPQQLVRCFFFSFV